MTLSKESNELDKAIGMLRQWLNEERIKNAESFVTNEELHHWLDDAIAQERAEADRLARINELKRLVPEPVAEMASINPKDELERTFDYINDRISELQKDSKDE